MDLNNMEQELLSVIKARGEFDGVCHVYYLDDTFNDILTGFDELTDLICCYAGENDLVSVLAMSSDDSDEAMLPFTQLSSEIQKKIYNFITGK